MRMWSSDFMNRTTELPLMHLIDHFRISLLNLCIAMWICVCVCCCFFLLFSTVTYKVYVWWMRSLCLHSASEIHSTHGINTCIRSNLLGSFLFNLFSNDENSSRFVCGISKWNSMQCQAYYGLKIKCSTIIVPNDLRKL